jgi:hypothetical protein
MKLARRIFLFCVVTFLVAYTVLWYLLANNLQKKLDEIKANSSINHPDYTISYSGFSKGGFPFRIEFSCNDIVETGSNIVVQADSTEQTTNIVTKYKQPIKFGYNILNQNFYISYKGEASSNIENSENGNSIKIDAGAYLDYGLGDFISQSLLGKGDTNNFQKLSSFNLAINQLLITDNLTGNTLSNIQDAFFKISKLNFKKDGYLVLATNLKFISKDREDIEGYFSNKIYNYANFLPKYDYQLESDIEISILQSSLLNNSGFIDFLKGLEIDIKTFKTQELYGTLELISKLAIPQEIFSDQNIIFQLNSIANLKPGFLNQGLKEIISDEEAMNSICENTERKICIDSINKVFEGLKDPKTLGVDLDMTLSLQPMSLVLHNSKLFIDDCSLEADGNADNVNLNFTVNISQYQTILDFIINNVLVNTPSPDLTYIRDYAHVYGKAFEKTLRFISTDATSSSSDIKFDNIAMKDNQLMVGKYSNTDIVGYYYQFLCNEALAIVQNKKNPKPELLNIMPFLKDNADLLDNLIKNANIQNKTI